MDENSELAGRVIGAAMEVHTRTGPGLLESAYHDCLALELTKRAIQFQRRVRMPILYDGLRLDDGYRIDFLVERKVVVQVKAVERLESIHTAQLLTRLELGGYRIGLLLNLDVARFGDGAVRRLILGPPPPRHRAARERDAAPDGGYWKTRSQGAKGSARPRLLRHVLYMM